MRSSTPSNYLRIVKMKLSVLLLSVVSVLSFSVLSACGQKDGATPPASASAVVVASAPVAAPENTVGKSVYGKTCSLCHAANVAGAPKPGDKADWAPRIAQGMDLVNKHALEGFTGTKGQMPARGGSTTLTDDEVKAAVAFMVDQSR
jgi:cytochrome c5